MESLYQTTPTAASFESEASQMVPQVIVPQEERYAIIRSTKRERSSINTRRNNHPDSEDEESLTADDHTDPTFEEEILKTKKPQRPSTKKQRTSSAKSKENDPAAVVRQLRSEKRSLEAKNKNLMNSLKAVTKESVLNARKGGKDVWDLGKIEGEFKKLNKEVKNWAKKYATTRKISSLSGSKVEDMLLIDGDDDLLSGSYQNVFSKHGLPTIENLPRGAQLLLEGLLFACICSTLIARPFIFMDTALKDHIGAGSHEFVEIGRYEKTFEKFAKDLTEYYPSSELGHKWTASMLQSLKWMIIPDPSEVTKSGKIVEKRSLASYRLYELGLSKLITVFLKSVNCLLKEDVSQGEKSARREDLKAVFRQFRELAYHMWCQPSTVECSYGQQDTSGSLDRLLFDLETMEIDSTATHGRQDTEAERLNGDMIIINLSPAIVGKIIDSHNENRIEKVTFLKQRVWTAECRTYAQWKASQQEDDGVALVDATNGSSFQDVL